MQLGHWPQMISYQRKCFIHIKHDDSDHDNDGEDDGTDEEGNDGCDADDDVEDIDEIML